MWRRSGGRRHFTKFIFDTSIRCYIELKIVQYNKSVNEDTSRQADARGLPDVTPRARREHTANAQRERERRAVSLDPPALREERNVRACVRVGFDSIPRSARIRSSEESPFLDFILGPASRRVVKDSYPSPTIERDHGDAGGVDDRDVDVVFRDVWWWKGGAGRRARFDLASSVAWKIGNENAPEATIGRDGRAGAENDVEWG